MRRKQRRPGRLASPKRASADVSRQLALAIEAPAGRSIAPPLPAPAVVSSPRSKSDASLIEEAILRTPEVVRMVNYHRCTLYRWMRAGEFPKRHRGKGWKRSEIERWLASDGSRTAN